MFLAFYETTAKMFFIHPQWGMAYTLKFADTAKRESISPINPTNDTRNCIVIF